MTMTPEQLLENFKTQQQTIADEIRKLDSELAQKKELYVKLQGALEGLGLLTTGEETPVEESQLADTEVVAEALS